MSSYKKRESQANSIHKSGKAVQRFDIEEPLYGSTIHVFCHSDFSKVKEHANKHYPDNNLESIEDPGNSTNAQVVWLVGGRHGYLWIRKVNMKIEFLFYLISFLVVSFLYFYLWGLL